MKILENNLYWALTIFFKPINFQIKSWIQEKISG